MWPTTKWYSLTTAVLVVHSLIGLKRSLGEVEETIDFGVVA